MSVKRKVFLITTWLFIALCWVFIGYTWWMSHQPIRDIGPCYNGMTLPPHSSCTGLIIIPEEGFPKEKMETHRP